MILRWVHQTQQLTVVVLYIIPNNMTYVISIDTISRNNKRLHFNKNIIIILLLSIFLSPIDTETRI